jgi:hypothetical protein
MAAVSVPNCIERADHAAADAQIGDEVVDEDGDGIRLAGAGHDQPDRADEHYDPTVVERHPSDDGACVAVKIGSSLAAVQEKIAPVLLC